MNRHAYIKGYMAKMAGFSDTIKSVMGGKGLGLTPDTGTSLPIDNRWLRSALVGAIPGAAINLYRNWDNEDQSKLKSLMYGAGTGAMAGLGAQALLPNGLPFNRPDSARYERNTNYNKVDSAQPVIDEQMQRSSPHPQYINSSMQRMLGGPTATA